MNQTGREMIKSGEIKIPDGWEIIFKEGTKLTDEYECYHWPNKCFYSMVWWKENDAGALAAMSNKVSESMCVIKPIKI